MKIQKIDYSEIKVDENQIRKEFPDQDLLVKSIIKQGLIEPLKVIKEKGIYRLIDGERRYRALKIIIESPMSDYGSLIDCIILSKPKNTTITQLTTDIHKNKISPFEEAEAYKKLIEEDSLSLSEICQLLGIDKQRVRGRLKLLAFDERTKGLIKDKKLSVSVAESLDIRTIKNNPGVINKIINQRANLKKAKEILLEDEGSYFRLMDNLFKKVYSVKEEVESLDMVLKRLSAERGIDTVMARRQIDNCTDNLDRLEKEIKLVYDEAIKKKKIVDSTAKLNSEELNLLDKMKKHREAFEDD